MEEDIRVGKYEWVDECVNNDARALNGGGVDRLLGKRMTTFVGAKRRARLRYALGESFVPGITCKRCRYSEKRSVVWFLRDWILPRSASCSVENFEVDVVTTREIGPVAQVKNLL